MTLERVQADAAMALLEDDGFIRDWAGLVEQCPWATGFQSPGYARAWYRTYRQQYKPLLLMDRSAAGLAGLLALGRNEETGALVPAGAIQCEYAGWVCDPRLTATFPPAALEALARDESGRTLRLGNMPAGIPLDWIESSAIGRRCVIVEHRRPLLRFGDGRDIFDSLHKRHNRKRLRQMGGGAGAELLTITDPAELDRWMDRIIACYDARHLTALGDEGFSADPLKRPFLLELMKEPGLLNAVVLKAGDEFAAASLGIVSRNQVEPGVLAHNPWLSRYSPGKFLMYMLAEAAMGQGKTQLDLTPGDDPYKERFANDSDSVWSLTVYPTAWRGAVGRRWGRIRRRIKRFMLSRNVTPIRLKQAGVGLCGMNPAHTCAGWTGSLRRWINGSHDMALWFADGIEPGPNDSQVHHNELADLLAYRDGQWRDASRMPMSRQAFVSAGMDRIEAGYAMYSCMRDGQLAGIGWWTHQPDASRTDELFPGAPIPPGSANINDLYVDRRFRRRGVGRRLLEAMLRDALETTAQPRGVYVRMPANCSASSGLLTSAGLVRLGTVFDRVRYGRRRRWTDVSVQVRPAQVPVEGPLITLGHE